MKFRLIMCVAALALCFTSPGYSQPSWKNADSFRKRFKKKRGKLLRKRLGFDDEKSKKVEAILENHAKEHQRFGQKIRAARRDLRKLLREDSNDQKAYQKALDEMQSAAANLQRLRREQFEKLKKILSPKEQAKLLRILNRVHRKLRERRRGRAGRRRGQGMGRPGGRPPRRRPGRLPR